MSKPNGKNTAMTILRGLGWPVLYGMAAWVGFYALLHQGIIRSPFIHRYFASHPVEYFEAALFFIGMAALVVKAVEIFRQYDALDRVSLESAPAGGQPVEDCGRLLESLTEQPAHTQNYYRVRRLRDALQYVYRKGSADDLDDELRHLADADAERQHAGYGLMRLITWAIPILGFLGTVIGITMALSNLSPTAIEESMGALTGAMGVAFDTTAVALALSIVLMFSQFLTEEIETGLLAAVDARTGAEFVGRFQQAGTGTDPQLVSVRRMAETVIQATELLVHKQAALWQETIEAANRRWTELVESASGTVESALAGALSESLDVYTNRLARSERESAERSGQLLAQVASAVEENAQLMRSQQRELVAQGQIMLKVIAATGEVASLQDTLNENLKSLAGAKNFEDTVMSLSAAIHLLNTRLPETQAGVAPVQLESPASSQSKDRAA